jgi:hypothetical protein
LHKASRGPPHPLQSEFCWQNIQIDFGFFVVRSSGRQNKSKKKDKQTNPEDVPSPLEVNVTTRSAARKAAHAATSHADTAPSSTTSSSDQLPPAFTTSAPSQQSRNSASSLGSHSSSPQVVTSTSQKYTLEKLVAHQGPLIATDKRYLGSPFNLKVKWSTGQTTWEPLHVLFQDVPRMVVEYATKHNLLDNDAWTEVRDLALDPSFQEAVDADVNDDDYDEDLPSGDKTALDFIPLNADASDAKARAAQERYKRLAGVNGETCYCLITDLKSGMWKVSIRRDKSPPLDFFERFLAHHAPPCREKTVRFDSGGELGRSAAVRDLFEKAGYIVEVTAPDSSSEVGQVERPHRTIADGVRTMLYASAQPPKFWPYALLHFVNISNCIPRGDRPHAPITMCTGKRPNISHLRIFGSRIYALPTDKRDAKIDVHARPGIFLGFKRSLKHAYYLDDLTGKVKHARHIAFDEGWNDSPDPPPYVSFLKGTVDPTRIHLDDQLENMAIVPSPFVKLATVDCSLQPSAPHPLGFQYERCPRFHRAYVSAFNRSFGPHSKDTANRKFLGGYILQIGKYPIFSPSDIEDAVRDYSAMPTPPSTVSVQLACDEKAHLSDSRPTPLHLRPVDIRRIAAMPLVAGEGTPAQRRSFLREVAATALPSATPPDPDDLIDYSPPELLEMRKLSNDHMTPEEKALNSFSRKHLKTLPNFDQWVAADRKQLDQHFDAGTIGHPIPRPVDDSQVFRIIWSRLVKATGIRKSRACLDGSKRSAPWLRLLVQTYSSCIELPCLRAFIATCVNRGYYIGFGDVVNAYQQSPPPTNDCFLEVDDEVIDWYYHRFKKTLRKFKDVIPLFHALQGHPEAGVLWERMINDILINKMDSRTLLTKRTYMLEKLTAKNFLSAAKSMTSL